MQSQGKGYVSGWGGEGAGISRDGTLVMPEEACALCMVHCTRADNMIVTHEGGGVVAGDNVLLSLQGSSGRVASRVGDGWVGADGYIYFI